MILCHVPTLTEYFYNLLLSEAVLQVHLWFDKPVLSTVHSFDTLRMNGVEGLTMHGLRHVKNQLIGRSP